MRRFQPLRLVPGLVALGLLLPACGERPAALPPLAGGAPTPAGYWEGKVTCTETPMKDHARELTRSVEAEIWFTVAWDAATGVGTAIGEAQATYDAVLKVKNLPKVTAPVPGGSVKFEPEVGGTLTKSDNRRRYPIVGVLILDPATGKGSLVLQKAAVADTRTEAERNDDEARGAGGPDAPMEFTIRANPGVSGGLSGAGGSVGYSGGRITGGAGGAELGADVGEADGTIVQRIPMKPFSPFASVGGAVEKRPGGPFVASFEERDDTHAIAWTVKQMGGEQREPLRLTPEMRAQIDALLAAARQGR